MHTFVAARSPEILVVIDGRPDVFIWSECVRKPFHDILRFGRIKEVNGECSGDGHLVATLVNCDVVWRSALERQCHHVRVENVGTSPAEPSTDTELERSVSEAQFKTS